MEHLMRNAKPTETLLIIEHFLKIKIVEIFVLQNLMSVQEELKKEFESIP